MLFELALIKPVDGGEQTRGVTALMKQPDGVRTKPLIGSF